MTTYFHCSGKSLTRGDTIKAGNWGRVIRTYTLSKPGGPGLVTAFRETVFDAVRKDLGLRVSRLDCLFVCSTEQELRHFMQLSSRMTEHIYEVEPIGDDYQTHYAKPVLINFGPNLAYFDACWAMARDYWTVPPQPGRGEILLDCDVRVLHRI